MQSLGELEELQSKIKKYEERLERTTDPANQTAMLTMLAGMRQELGALRQKEVLLLLREPSCERSSGRTLFISSQ